jgi:hypothetical protein
LYFGDRVAVLNDFIYQTGGSTSFGSVQISNEDNGCHACVHEIAQGEKNNLLRWLSSQGQWSTKQETTVHTTVWLGSSDKGTGEA